MNSTPRKWTLRGGTTVKVSGLPYELVNDTEVSGFYDPSEIIAGAATSQQSADCAMGVGQPVAEIPARLRGIMESNSAALEQVTSKSLDSHSSEQNREKDSE